jgi:protein-disulfide isomerase
MNDCPRGRLRTATATALAIAVAVLGGCRTRSAPAGNGAADAMTTASAVSTDDARSPAQSDDEAWERTKTVYRVDVGNSPVRGSGAALVTIVQFADFVCAPCSAVEPTLAELRAHYGDKIRFVWKNDPTSFHAGAEEAAEAALEVRAEKGDAAFWEFHDRLVARQAGGVDSGATNAGLVAIASEVGADGAKVARAIARRAHHAEIEADLELGEDLDNKGTLHFFINGRRLEGAQPRARFERMIDEEIRNAQSLVDRGAAPRDLYAALTKDGRGPRPLASKDVPKSLPSTDPALGSASAKVTIHVWSDYQCALCVAVERAIEELRKEYGDRVRFIWHDLPLPRHADARLVAEAGREAYAQKGVRAFWSMHDRIFHHPQSVTRSDLDAFAKDMRLDKAKWDAALDHDGHANEIAADVQAAADDGITETPAYLVVPGASSRGYFVDATQEAEKLRRVVERAFEEL